MANQRQSLYLFGSLEVHRTAYSGTTYTIDDKTLVPYLMSNGVRLARLHYEIATTVPQVAGTGLTDELGKTNTAATLHVLLELGDHLGSSGTVLDKVSSELVEKTGYLPFGARESDYRPSRWNGFREDYGFTGKEEDVQVGLVYFGKRYLSPQLGRWLSPDPLAVHAPGRADFNLYAYVAGAVLKNVDPVGLDAYSDWDVGTSANEQEAAKSSESSGMSGTPDAGSKYFGTAQTASSASPKPAATYDNSRQISVDPNAPTTVDEALRVAWHHSPIGAAVDIAQGVVTNVSTLVSGTPERNFYCQSCTGQVASMSVPNPDEKAVALGQLASIYLASVGARNGSTSNFAKETQNPSAPRVGVRSGAEVTESTIQQAMKDASLGTDQGAVSLPAVRRYVDRLAGGETPPPIKVDSGVIVDGNHRYVAGRVFGEEPPQTPGTRPMHKSGPGLSWDQVKVDPTDWGNR